MATDKDIIATASDSDPEVLELDTLDSIIGGAEYGGTNTCEPVDRPKGHGKWIDVLSWSWGTKSSFEQVTGGTELRMK